MTWPAQNHGFYSWFQEISKMWVKSHSIGYFWRIPTKMECLKVVFVFTLQIPRLPFIPWVRKWTHTHHCSCWLIPHERVGLTAILQGNHLSCTSYESIWLNMAVLNHAGSRFFLMLATPWNGWFKTHINSTVFQFDGSTWSALSTSHGKCQAKVVALLKIHISWTYSNSRTRDKECAWEINYCSVFLGGNCI